MIRASWNVCFKSVCGVPRIETVNVRQLRTDLCKWIGPQLSCFTAVRTVLCRGGRQANRSGWYLRWSGLMSIRFWAFLRFFYTLERKRCSTLETMICCFASQPLVSNDFVVLKIP